ncbi:MAG: type 4a pilus biogenesis protein PilO [Longimicrobiales bacterium]|nr:type 4a pilus biogenesis protein PilO [Longimicrobiales bacterium]
MALIPSEPRQRNALLALVVAAVAFYGFWEYWRAPAQEALVASQERLERLESQNSAARVRALQKERLEQQAAVYERYVRRLESLVPAAEEVPALLRDITAEARRLNVDLNLIEPQGEEQGAYYARTAYTMRVIGEYHDVGRFLTTVASLPRIITPVNVTMQPYRDTDFLQYDAGVVVDFEIETYVLPSGLPPAGAAPGEGQ